MLIDEERVPSCSDAGRLFFSYLSYVSATVDLVIPVYTELHNGTLFDCCPRTSPISSP